MMAGLGIDLNPTLRGQPAALPSNNNNSPSKYAFPSSSSSLGSINEAAAALNSQHQVQHAKLGQGFHETDQALHSSQRRVRIVSAANVYHESAPTVSARLVAQSSTGSGSQYEDEDEDANIYDGYAGSPIVTIDDHGSLYSAPAMSARSTSAQSGASSTRHHVMQTMEQAKSLPSRAAEEFEAELRLALPPKADAYTAQYPEAPLMHPRSYSVDDAYSAVPDVTVSNAAHTANGQYAPLPAITRTLSEQPYIPPHNAPVVKTAPGLKRAGALSRPKSMLELSHLFAMQSVTAPPEPAAITRVRPTSHYFDTVGIPTAPGMSRDSSAATSSSPRSVMSATSYDSASTAATSAYSDSHSYKSAGQRMPVAAPPRSHQLVKAKSAMSMRTLEAAQGSEQSYAGQLRSPAMSRANTESQYSHEQRQAIRNRAMTVAASRIASLSIQNPTQAALARQPTLLSSKGANPAQHARQLSRLLDPKTIVASRHAQHTPQQPWASNEIPTQPVFQTTFDPVGAIGPTGHIGQITGLRRKPSAVALEQAVKGKARAELDLHLASSTVVEGGLLRGRMEVRVRKMKDNEGELWLGAVKARIVGFEELANEEARHVFYHHAALIDGSDCGRSTADALACYDSLPDAEGFRRAKVGTHAFAFNMQVPVGNGAKGCMKSKQGVVKYIFIGSVKLKSRDGSQRSIAHFYRHLEVYPYLNPAIILAPDPLPHVAESTTGAAKVKLTISLHRLVWVAGQRCYVDIKISNEASKKVKSINLSLNRTQTVFKQKGADETETASATQVIRKKVAENSLDMGKKGTKGTVTAKGMWLGVDKGEEVCFLHALEIPADELSVEKGRFIEVTYSLKVAISGSLASEVKAELPIRIINFLSIDPPPGHIAPNFSAQSASASRLQRSLSTDHIRNMAPPAPHPIRQASMDTLDIVDLNRMVAMPRMGRQYSCDSTASGQTDSSVSTYASSGMSKTYTMPELASIREGREPPEEQHHRGIEAVQRQIRHQMSLDCIGSAIASATARRGSQARPLSGIQEDEYMEEEEADATVQDFGATEYRYPHADAHANEAGIQLDDLDEIPDDDVYVDLPYEEYPVQAQRAQIISAADACDYFEEYEDESEDEVDLVLQTKHFEMDDEGSDQARPSIAFGSTVSLSPTQMRTALSSNYATASPLRPTSRVGLTGQRSQGSSSLAQSPKEANTVVVKATVDPDVANISQRSMSASQGPQFGLATTASPVKKGKAPLVTGSTSVVAAVATPQRRPPPVTSARKSPNPGRCTSSSPASRPSAYSSPAPRPSAYSNASPIRNLTTSSSMTNVRHKIAALEASPSSKGVTVNVPPSRITRAAVKKISSVSGLRREYSVSSAASCSTGRLSPATSYS